MSHHKACQCDLCGIRVDGNSVPENWQEHHVKVFCGYDHRDRPIERLAIRHVCYTCRCQLPEGLRVDDD